MNIKEKTKELKLLNDSLTNQLNSIVSEFESKNDCKVILRQEEGKVKISLAYDLESLE